VVTFAWGTLPGLVVIIGGPVLFFLFGALAAVILIGVVNAVFLTLTALSFTAKWPVSWPSPVYEYPLAH